MPLSIFSWLYLFPRPSATSSISAADRSWSLKHDFISEAKQTTCLESWFLPLFPDLETKAHITWSRIWLPQSCQRDQVIELDKSTPMKQTETNWKQKMKESCQINIISLLSPDGLLDAGFCHAVCPNNAEHGQAGAQLMEWLSLCGSLWSSGQHANTSSCICFPLLSATLLLFSL